MSGYIAMGRGGIIDIRRIAVVASTRSAPVKRMIAAVDPARVINLTYGYPRETVLVLDSGLLVITSLTIKQLTSLLGGTRIDPYEPQLK